MSEIIPKEKLAGFQRWQVNSFDQPKPEAAPPAAPETQLPAAEETDQSAPFNLPTADDIERLYEEARSTGYQAGYDEGRQAAEESVRQATAAEARRFLALTDSLQQALDELDQNVAEQLLALATEIATQVIGGVIAVKSDVLLPIIREAVTALPIHHTHLTVRLNPDDAAQVRGQIGEQLAQSGAQIIEDREISIGGCLIRAGSSEVDATIETRWKRVLEAIGAEPTAWLNP
ncbi:MAG: flagellar assembly protein FliH [Bacteroidota bacterium]